jgi:RNA-binding protein YhbY
MVNMIEMQIGKKGLTPEFTKDVKTKFDKVENIRVRVLQSATRDKAKLLEIKETVLKELGPKFTCRVIGYTLIFKKWRKARS